MDKEQKITLARVIIAAVIFAAGELLHHFAGSTDIVLFGGLKWLTVSTACFLAAYIVAGAGVLIEAVEHIIHGSVFDEDFLMGIATIGAICLQQFDEAAGVMVFFLIGELFEEFAEGRSRSSISELMDIRPDFATLLTGTISSDGIVGGIEQQVDPADVHIGDIIIVKPGEKVPLDGKVVSGRASLDTSALTGESLPAEIEEGSHIVSGCIDLDGVIRVKVESEFGESTVSKILDLVENASSKKAHIEKFITRFARIYTPAVVGAAALLAVIPPLFVPGQMWHTWVYRALLFLVISCPCALVISVPLSFFGGIGAASKSGVLVKGSNYLEALGKVDTVIFDKTGTITTGSFTVTDVVGPDDLLETAAHAEYYSNHPISKSIIEAYAAVGGRADPSRVSDIEEIAGKGLSANVDGRKVYAGNAKLMDDLRISGLNSDDAATLVHVAVEENGSIRYYGSISIEDTIKPCSIAAVSRLAAAGVKRTVMLTGDRKVIADKIAHIVGISEVHSELLPADKVAIAEGIIGGRAISANSAGSSGKNSTGSSGESSACSDSESICDSDCGDNDPEKIGRNTGSRSGKVAFVGDGINDAPVLARADVGIAMGALGSQAAIEAADVVIMDDDLEKIGKVIDIARKTTFIARQNVTIALTIKGIILILGAIGLANMWAAVFADVGVTMIAIINAMRTLLIK